MSTTTPNLSLLKPAGTEFVNEVTQLNDNWDKIDAMADFAVPLFGRKSADQTVTNNTLIDDAEMRVSIKAGKTYRFLFMAILQGSAVGDCMVGPNIAGGGAGTISYSTFGLNQNSTYPNDMNFKVNGGQIAAFPASGLPFFQDSPNWGAAPVIGVGNVVCTTNGILVVRWAQNVTDAGGLTMKAGSHLEAQRVA